MTAEARRFPATDLPAWQMLTLLAIGLPRTLLAELGVVEPESGLLYYLLALVPFATWLAVAVGRRSRRPFLDFVVLGALYGVSLLLVHQALWDVGPALGGRTASAVDFAARFGRAPRAGAPRLHQRYRDGHRARDRPGAVRDRGRCTAVALTP